ncbi:hypothetical protein TFLX_06265 [Thermoflexales bacterium]|nr:hypothetical protein TFLX_06265 [Thermoflexales bacterium]
MAKNPKHMQWLTDTGRKLRTSDGRYIKVWEFCHQRDDQILLDWAKHFRNQYCLDNQIDLLRRGTGLSRKEYLINRKFPDVAVPRARYANKIIRNESVKGSDIVGFQFIKNGKTSLKDLLAIFEVKAQLTGKKAKCRLQEAVDDSCKDLTRKADTLNAIKQRLLDGQNNAAASRVERFQNPVDKPYRDISGAVAIFSEHLFDPPKS